MRESIQAILTSPLLPAAIAGKACSTPGTADETLTRGSQVSPPLVDEEK